MSAVCSSSGPASNQPSRIRASGWRAIAALGLWSALMIGASIVAASCADGTGGDSTTTHLAPTTTTRAAPAATSTSTTTTTEATPTLDVPPLLVAHEGGIDLWTPDASTPLLTGRAVAVAVADRHGGVVFQEVQEEFGRAMPIMWLSMMGATPEMLIDSDDAFSMTLVQVSHIDAETVVVYRKWVEAPNDCLEDDRECRWDYHQEYLMARDLHGGSERNLGGIGTFESDILGVSLGGDRVAFSINRYEGGACTGWLPLTALYEASGDGWIGEGSELEEACRTGPTPSCPAGERCEGMARAAVSPDGNLLVYAFSEWRPETGEHVAPTVVVHDPVAGIDLFRVDVGEAGVQPSWLDYDGRFVLLGRTDIRLPGGNQPIEPLLIDPTGQSVPVPITGRATLWSNGGPPTSGHPHDLPIDDDWTVTHLTWPVQPACCDSPALGPTSPSGPIPESGPWPDVDFSQVADGFYDATVTRVWEPPGVVALSLRRWVSCAEVPERCPIGAPSSGIVADPATQVDTHLVLGDGLTVVIAPLQTWQDGRFPDPPRVITGSGSTFYELLSGWCGGYLPERNPVNCGIDHAFGDWIWSPHQSSESIDQILAELDTSDTVSSFPFTLFDDRATEVPCSADRRCPTAYRGPQGSHFIVDVSLLEPGEDWRAGLYGWWTSLEIRDGKPILYIDAGRLAG